MREWSATSFMFFCFILVSLFFFFFNEPENVYLTFLLSLYVRW